MKALKEKRISLRSLWRMGLVILSVFALAFASCGSSSGDNSSPEGFTGREALSMTVVQYPSSAGGLVFEGLPVDLTGIQVSVRYSDNTWGKITNPKDLKVSPSIYELGRFVDNKWYPNQGYTITYCGSKDISTVVTRNALGNHRRLLDVNWTGTLNKQEYLIDELPEFAGLSGFEGVYNSTNDKDDNTANDSGTQQATYYHRAIPLTISNPDYRWRWVYNLGQTGGTINPDPNFAGDNHGVLLAIGSFGDMSGAVHGYQGSNFLTGVRIPVRTLYQVSSIEYVTPPDFSQWPIFLDDPSLLGPEYREGRWVRDIFGGVEFKVNYAGTDKTNIYNIRDFLTLGGGNDSYLNPGPEDGIVGNNPMPNEATAIPGLWKSLEMRFLGLDSTTSNSGTEYVNYELVTPAGPGVPYDRFDYYEGTDLDWHDWGRLKNPRVEFRFRDKYIIQPIPVYTKLAGIEVISRNEDGSVLMDGSNEVYIRPESLNQFWGKVRVRATYTGNANVTSETAVGIREDVDADIGDGYCRAVIANVLPAEDTLFSENVIYAAGQGTILTLDNCIAFRDKGKLQKANVTFVFSSPLEEISRKAGSIMIGMRNYTFAN